MGRFAAGKLRAPASVLSVLIGGRWPAFSVQDFDTPDPAARSTGHDARWLGHAWVSGQDTVAQVEQLAATLRGHRDIRPLRPRGPAVRRRSLDPAKASAAAWFVRQVRALIPGVRVQACLGDATPTLAATPADWAAYRADWSR
jgi:hypothetical protein